MPATSSASVAPAVAPPERRAWTTLGVVLAAAVAFYWRFGYGYGADDHDDILPELLRRMDPAFFPTDPFVVERADGVSVRTAFLLVLRGVVLVLPLPAAVALVHAVVFAATAWGVYRLALAFLPDDRPAAALATLAAVAGVVKWTLGGNAVAYDYLVPEALAWALVLPALRLFAGGRRLVPALLLGPAAWIHPLVGLLTAGALGLTGLIEAAAAPREDRRRLALGVVGFGAAWLLAAAPGLVPVVLEQAGAPDDGTPSGFYLYARLRVPHHYLPTAFGLGAYARFGIVAAAGLAGLVVLHRWGRLRHARFVGAFLAAIALMGLVAFVAVVAFESLAVARLQVFKLTVLANVVLVIGAAGALVAVLPGRVRGWAEAPFRRPGLALIVVGAAAALTLGLAAADVGRPGALYAPRAHARSDLGRVERWASEATPPEALVAVPPSNTTFRVHARRGVTGTWKAFPFEPERMRVWLARLRTVAPAPLPPSGRGYLPALDSAYCANGPADWPRIARALRADYALVEAGCGPPAGSPVFRSGRWAVYPLR